MTTMIIIIKWVLNVNILIIADKVVLEQEKGQWPTRTHIILHKENQ